MSDNLTIIKEVAEEAQGIYCYCADCTNCVYNNFKNCSYTYKNSLIDKIVTALAIERVKEKANESKD